MILRSLHALFLQGFVRLFDAQTFEVLHSHNLGGGLEAGIYEMPCSITSCSFADDPNVYYCVRALTQLSETGWRCVWLAAAGGIPRVEKPASPVNPLASGGVGRVTCGRITGGRVGLRQAGED